MPPAYKSYTDSEQRAATNVVPHFDPSLDATTKVKGTCARCMRRADEMRPVPRPLRAVHALDEEHRGLGADRVLQVHQTVERDAHAQDDCASEGNPERTLLDAAFVQRRAGAGRRGDERAQGVGPCVAVAELDEGELSLKV